MLPVKDTPTETKNKLWSLPGFGFLSPGRGDQAVLGQGRNNGLGKSKPVFIIHRERILPPPLLLWYCQASTRTHQQGAPGEKGGFT